MQSSLPVIFLQSKLVPAVQLSVICHSATVSGEAMLNNVDQIGLGRHIRLASFGVVLGTQLGDSHLELTLYPKRQNRRILFRMQLGC